MFNTYDEEDWMRGYITTQPIKTLIERAKKLVEGGASSAGKKKQNDPKRFIKTDHATKDGEVAEISANYIDQSVIEDEEKYDGFYAVCTNHEV